MHDSIYLDIPSWTIRSFVRPDRLSFACLFNEKQFQMHESSLSFSLEKINFQY